MNNRTAAISKEYGGDEKQCDSKEVYAIGHELPPNGSVPLEGVGMKIGEWNPRLEVASYSLWAYFASTLHFAASF